MNKLLIAVKSCKRDWARGHHDIILNTWGKNLPPDVDIRFFTGNAACSMLAQEPEQVNLNIPDDYMSLPQKTREILRWSIERDYGYTFLCDVDTFLIPFLLIRTGFEKFDFSGRFGSMPKIGTTFHYRDAHGDYPNCHPWASGGVGYFLSRKAGELVAHSTPEVWAEDMFVGQVLGPYIQSGEIIASDIPDFECQVSWHFPRRQYNNESYDPIYGWMEKMYADHH